MPSKPISIDLYVDHVNLRITNLQLKMVKKLFRGTYSSVLPPPPWGEQNQIYYSISSFKGFILMSIKSHISDNKKL